jgi:hypothetical protein
VDDLRPTIQREAFQDIVSLANAPERNGEVRSNQCIKPIRITSEETERRNPKDKLPTIKEMSGLVEDMYEGKTLKEYLRDIRDW